MYATLWYAIPGPLWVRILVMLLLIAVVLFSLVTWVFPWVNGLVNNQEVTVQL